MYPKMDIFNMDSDSDVYSTDSSDSEEFEFEGRETLTKIDETLAKIDDFLSFERSFSHGDIVSSVSDPTGQLGKIIELDMAVDLETLSGEIVNKVNSKTLVRLRSFLPGDYVVLGFWIGRVTEVFDLVNILFDDGTRSEILVRDPDMLVPIEENRYEEIPSFYHPGQRVRVENDLTRTGTKTLNPKWLCGDWGTKIKENEGVICKIEIGLVKIHWILSISNIWGENYKSTPPISPNSLQNPKNITLISCFQHAKWQLGDWCTLTNSNRTGTGTVPTNSSLKMEKNDHGRYGKGYRDEIYTISKTKTLISVLWQNGSVSTRLDPQTLIPITNLGDHDFWPGQFVLEKESKFETNKKIGIIKKVDSKERIIRVNWNNNKNAFNAFNEEEIVSAYELIENNEFSYSVGEIVIRIICEKEIEKGEKNELDFLGYFGNFLGFKEGFMEVIWANGVLSKVDPNEICGLERLAQIVPPPLNPNSVPVLNPNSDTETGMDTNSVEKEEERTDEIISNDNYSMSIFPKIAFDYFRNFFTGGSSSSGKNEANYEILKPIESIIEKTELREKTKLPLKELKESEEKTEIPLKESAKKNEKELKKCKEKTEMPLEEIKEFEEKTEMSLNEIKEFEEKTEIPLSEKQREFKRFDVLNECSDNYFINQLSNSSQVKKSWLKKIQQEWNILENNLPESIYVRVYEERMDILRTCIIGANGTPYHDGLFFFDILFPPTYPLDPPNVHYHSGGLRLNPNLYESGKVCLSLLKTWTGTGTETWDPQNSTILQVLLSLQGLVLNAKPYFNEAGFDKQIGRLEGEKNSVNYNENVVLLSCKNMMYVINKPPKDFEELVKEHFAIRAPFIFQWCKAYLNGAQVGSYYDNNNNLLGESCSTGFKLMLVKLVPKLVSAFSQIGIDCDPLMELKYEY